MALTKFRQGSLRELWHITFPLMISFWSIAFTTFIDRLFIAYYSSDALNAIVSGTTVGWTFILGWIILVAIAETFVSQNNGAKNYKELGNFVWQSIWLSVSSCIVFLPLAFFTDDLFFTHPSQQLIRDYLRLMFYFAPLYPLYFALYSFFVGQGKTYVVTILLVIASFLHIGLDYCLIFGISGWLPSFGLKGSAIATGLSNLFQVVTLFILFLNLANRKHYGTHYWHIHAKTLRQYIKIGLPGAIFAIIEMSAWIAYYTMIMHLGKHHLTIASITQSLLVLFYFFIEATSRAIGAIAGNLIGSQQSQNISKTLRTGLYLYAAFSSVLLLVSYVFIDQIASYFLPHTALEEVESIKPGLLYCLMVFSCYLFFEGLRSSLVKILTAAGDTFFLLIGGSLSIWILLVWPVYQLVYINKGSIEQATTIILIYSILTGGIYLIRFYQGYWKSLCLLEKKAVQYPPNSELHLEDAKH